MNPAAGYLWCICVSRGKTQTSLTHRVTLESPLDLSMFEHRTTTDKMGTLIQLYDLPALADRQHTEVPLFMVQLHTANVS